VPPCACPHLRRCISQANGSKFLDSAGKNDFAGPGEIGMLDWGAFAPNGAAGAQGTKALRGKLSRGLSMARTLGVSSASARRQGACIWRLIRYDTIHIHRPCASAHRRTASRCMQGDPNQVAKAGRRTLVGWGSATYTFQTLLQDLTLGGTEAAPFLRQQFIPELQVLRDEGSTGLATSQQFEVVASLIKPPARRQLTARVTGGTAWTCAHPAYFTVLGHTKVGVCYDSRLVFVDTSAQPLLGKLGNSGIRAGPLYGDPTALVHVHLIVDHCVLAVIVNNRTSLTVQVGDARMHTLLRSHFCAHALRSRVARALQVTPGQHDGGVEKGPGSAQLQAWTLKTANENTQKTPQTPWLTPKIHNSPACL
jgi:hypothetical protein